MLLIFWFASLRASLQLKNLFLSLHSDSLIYSTIVEASSNGSDTNVQMLAVGSSSQLFTHRHTDENTYWEIAVDFPLLNDRERPWSFYENIPRSLTHTQQALNSSQLPTEVSNFERVRIVGTFKKQKRQEKNVVCVSWHTNIYICILPHCVCLHLSMFTILSVMRKLSFFFVYFLVHSKRKRQCNDTLCVKNV